MSEQPHKKRQLKPAQTVRQRSQRAQTESELKKQKEHKLIKRLSKIKAIMTMVKIIRTIGRFVVPKYLRTSYAELKQVTWPSMSESRRLTLAVLGFAVVFGALVASLDYGLSHLFKIILLK